MATKAGVWIDHKQAIVVLITSEGREIKKFTVEGKRPDRPVGSPRPKNSYTPNDFTAEDRRERKLVMARTLVYNDVLTCIRGADALLVLGPGEAKGEFRKHILARKLRGVAVEVATADKMTERQLAAQVSGHFATAPSGKAAAPKKPVKRKLAKATSASRLGKAKAGKARG